VDKFCYLGDVLDGGNNSDLLGLEPVSLMIKKSRSRWFRHVECKGDSDWVKHFMTLETEGIRADAQRRCGRIVSRLMWKV